MFGGRKSRKLVVRYRLREAGRAVVSLYRGKKRIKRLSAGNRRANQTYKHQDLAEEAAQGRDLHGPDVRAQRRRQAHAVGAPVGQAAVVGGWNGGAAG